MSWNTIWPVPWIRLLRTKLRELRSMETIFNQAYKIKFGGQASASGPGSELDSTRVIRAEIPKVLNSVGARSILDAPCGDFHWMRFVELEGIDYFGIDIVTELVNSNKRLYKNENRHFLRLDITKEDLPRVDLIFCRDCLVHLSYNNIWAALKRFKSSRARYLMTTTFTAVEKNRDIATGEWRPLNLERPPFSFPPPDTLVIEGCREGDGQYSDKALGLWEISNLPLENKDDV